MRLLPSLLSGVAVALLRAPAHAQAPLHFRVLDTGSASPIRRARVTVGRDWAASGDSVGYVRLEHVPDSSLMAVVMCRPPSGAWRAGRIELRSVPLPRSRADTVIVRLDAAACDQATTPRLRVTLTGTSEWLYHDTAFAPCRSDWEALPGPWRDATLAHSWSIVLGGVPQMRRFAGTRPPTDTSGRRHRDYVRVEGVLEGPARFGNRGGASFLLEVEAIVAVYPALPTGCQ